MAEILFEHHEPEAKAFIMEHFRVDIEERVKAFHAETGEWPAFRRDPYGRGLTMGTQAEIAQLPRVEVSRKTPAAEQRTRTASLLPRGIPLRASASEGTLMPNRERPSQKKVQFGGVP